MNIRAKTEPARLLIFVSLLLCGLAARAGEDQTADRYRAHVIVMGPGEELFARFGHIALMIEDRQKDTRDVYNFGLYDFSDPDLRAKYVKGFLLFHLGVESYARTVRVYRRANREIVLRTLNLSSAQVDEIKRRLEINARPENRVYEYRHYLDNCCTRIRDLLDDVTGGAVSKGRKSGETNRTYRDWTHRALEGLPVLRTLITFSLGPAVDRPITRYDEQFLPEVLAADLDITNLGSDGRPLVSEKKILGRREGPPLAKSVPRMDWIVIFSFFGILLIGLALPAVLGERKIAKRLTGFGLVIWGLLSGLGGLALILYWTATTHYDTHYNENLLVMPILHFWLVGPGLKLIVRGRLAPQTVRLVRIYLVAALALLLVDILLKLGPFIQDNSRFVIFAAACNFAALLSLWRSGLKRAG